LIKDGSILVTCKEVLEESLKFCVYCLE